jgi:solute carrier family 25 carnitine/acylcarnitine transporter 20/29
MQLDNISRRQYHNSLHCLSILLKDNGVKVLYTGFSVNTLREVVYLGSYFWCYEGVRESLIKQSFSLKIAVPIAGGLAGSLGWLISFPLDSVRARVQGQTLMLGHHQFPKKQTAVELASTFLKERGVTGLYSGVTPSIIRAFVVSGVRFSAYEFVIFLMSKTETSQVILM